MDDFLYNLRRETDKRNRRQGGQQQYRGPDRRGPKDQRRNYPRRNEATEQVSELLPEIKSLLESMSETQKQFLNNEKRKMQALENIAASLRLMSGNNQPIEVEEEVETPAPQEASEAAETTDSYETDSDVESREAVAEESDESEEPPLVSTREEIREIALSLREKGKTYKEIAQYLDDEKIPTFSGKGGWHAPTIHKLCK